MEVKENRVFSRHKVQNMYVDISDGTGFFSGSIGNISRKGLYLQHISKKLSDNASWLDVVVTKNEANFKMTVRTRWKKYSGYTKDIGVKIVHAPPAWNRYIDKIE